MRPTWTLFQLFLLVSCVLSTSDSLKSRKQPEQDNKALQTEKPVQLLPSSASARFQPKSVPIAEDATPNAKQGKDNGLGAPPTTATPPDWPGMPPTQSPPVSPDKFLDEVALETLQYGGDDDDFGRKVWKVGHEIKYPHNAQAQDDHCSGASETDKITRSDLATVKNSLLESLMCGRNNCSKIIVFSDGKPVLRHPARFGLYTLTTMHDVHPVFTRHASKQHLFYQRDFNKWPHSHRIQRWIIGPDIGESVGGILILNAERCPWRINFAKTETYFYDRPSSGVVSPRVEGWRGDKSVGIKCHDHLEFPAFSCGCSRLNVSSTGGAFKLHNHVLGTYSQRPSGGDDFLAPVFEKDLGEKYFLYSHHHEGKLWLLGRSLVTWSLRLNMLNAAEYGKDAEGGKFESGGGRGGEGGKFESGDSRGGVEGGFCPNNDLGEDFPWEFLALKEKEEEYWESDRTMTVMCVPN